MGSDGDLWSVEDRFMLRTALEDLRDASTHATLTSPELTHLLAMEPGEMIERLLTHCGVVHLVSALIFAGTISVALDPMDVEAVPPGSERLADAFNALGAVLATLSGCTAVHTAFILGVVVTSVTRRTVYRVVVQLRRTFAVLHAALVLLLASALGMCALAVGVRSSREGAWAAWGAMGLCLVVFHAFLVRIYVTAFPSVATAWLPLAAAGCGAPEEASGRIRGELARDAEKHIRQGARGALFPADLEARVAGRFPPGDGELTSRQSAEGQASGEGDVRGAAGPGPASVASTAPTMSAPPADLLALLRGALPETSEDRRRWISAALHAEGLSASRLRREASQGDAGLLFRVLADVLGVAHSQAAAGSRAGPGRAAVTRGEALAIIQQARTAT